jgi:hypothetical protein
LQHVLHDGLVKAFNALLLFVEEGKVADDFEGFLKLVDQLHEVQKAVVSDMFLDLGDSVLEVLDLLRHDTAPLNPPIQRVQL